MKFVECIDADTLHTIFENIVYLLLDQNIYKIWLILISKCQD